MKLKDMINQNTPEIIKKLLYGLDYNTSYVVEFYRDTSVEVKEVKRVIDRETDEIIYVEKWFGGDYETSKRNNKMGHNKALFW